MSNLISSKPYLPSALQGLANPTEVVMPTATRVEMEQNRRKAMAARAANQESIEESKARCKSLVGFIREAWHVVEPFKPYVHGWHIDAICDHLTAVHDGDLNRLLMNVPPGTMKSLTCSVLFPAWEWGPKAMPFHRYFTTSYVERLVTRDSRKMRDLVLSDWFQERWPEVRLVRHGETSFENTMKGWREGVPFKSLTGGRGTRVIADDPHSTEQAESDADRETASRIFHESMPSRLDDPIKDAIIVMMQRLHADDISGIILREDLGYHHLMLPMEFEPERKCTVYLKDKLFFEDPRKEAGELLFPGRFPRAVVDRDKKVMGSYAVAGQFQQRPTVREGGLFKASWLSRIVDRAPVGTRWVRCWDIAATEEQLGNNPAWTVGLKLGRTPEGQFIVGDVIRKRVEGPEVRKLMKAVAKIDGKGVEIGFPLDPGAAGKIVAADLVKFLAGWVTHALPQSGDKISRAEPVASQAEAGNLFLMAVPEGLESWHKTFVDECTEFPGSMFKDQVDALSGAFSMLMEASLFNTNESEIMLEPTRILSLWQRCCAIEVTSRRFYAVWAAYDRNTKEMTVYDTYSMPLGPMAVHADALRTRGQWIPVLFDPRSRQRKEDQGIKTAQALADRNVEIMTIPFDLEAGVLAMSGLLDSRQLRVFEHRRDWFDEFRRLHRDEAGDIEDKDNELIRCTAMLALYGADVAISEVKAESDRRGYDPSDDRRGNSSTGY